MTDGLKPFPAMKESGVPWLGRVPEQWEARKLRHCGAILGGMTPSMEDRSLWGGNVPWVTPKDMKRFTIAAASMNVAAKALEATSLRLIPVGSVLLVVRGMILARRVPIARTSQPVTINQDMKAIVPVAGIDGGYLAYCMDASQEAFIPMIDEAGHGTKRFPTDRWKNLQLFIPPIDQQLAIVRYLDHADRLIRRYVATKRKLIKCLEEQKQAIIHRAVTRGLDPSVRLKPSGVDWLGDVPEHWELVRNGRLFVQRNETGFGELPILEVSLRTGVRVRQLEGGARKQVMIDREKYKRAAKGDLAYNMMRMWQGAVGAAPVDGLISPAYVVASPLPGVEVRYFSSLFRTPAYMGEVNDHSRGIVKDRNRLYWEDFKQIFSPCPPQSEQRAIADFVDSDSTSTAVIVGQVEREIGLLREYRTRLIADVVTGKLDVRAAAAALSDAVEDAEPVDAIEESDPEEETSDGEIEPDEAAA